ncbi:S8 family serine peptidase [Crocosphaera sp. XPORK-15E]|uniref:S8 family serine peptidase n=1 Tax=Crocosphaera sp. XPORK-15E TaxID=3110247 RepID=UPI002B1FF6B4|nr:S8 family serine peptidase [Crocosphaera sp. XPORK-15E]MEA5536850.1 S8 family serine peptidase [Crocosphaera sp. XPORK-15E]
MSVRINLTNGTATVGSDYNNSQITVNFAEGETSKTVTIPIIDDSILESNETINLSLSNPTNGATIGTQNSAIVNIIDNDFKPTLTVNINTEQITEGNTIQGTVTRNTDTTEPLTVTLVNSDNTQITVPTTVTIPAGANSANFNITAVDDTLIELPKNHTIIASSSGFISGSDSLAIIDNDGVTLTLTVDTSNINENGGKAQATVTRNIVTDTPLQVQLFSSDTTEATVPTTVIIAANQASATFEIQGVDDTILDGTQTAIITAKSTYTGTNIASDAGKATININVIDNESPSLKVVIDKDVISETGTATATISRNTDTSSDLIVNLNSSDTTEATIPNTVIIPVGQTSATFTITGVSDGINDGSQAVTINASANGLNSGSDSLEVTDINVPDLVVTQLQGIQPTYTGKQSQLTYTITNNGIISASGNWKDRVYLSTDNKLDANDTLLGEFGLGSVENPANLLPSLSYDRTVTYFAPRTPGQYYLIGVTDTGNTVNEGVNIGENNNTTITPVTITPAYRATVYTDTETALAGNPITLRGTALSNNDNSPVAYESVKIRIENKGNIREFDSFTDGNGNFIRQFTPLQGEAGNYNINAYFPGFAAEDSAAEDQFTLLGMRFEQNDQFLTQVSQRITEGTTFNGSVKLQNLSDLGLSGLTASINGAPTDWTVNLTPEKTSLLGNEEITVNYSINVPDDKWSYYNFSVGLSSNEGVTATLPIRVDVAQLLPRLVADTSNLQASMLRGGQTLVEFTVSNQGAIASGELDILLPDAPWLKLASTVTLPSLNPGESTKVSLLLQPSATQELTLYNGNVVISGDEASLSLPFNFRAISEAKGNLNINVVDELFFFAEGSPRLANATISLLDPYTGTVIFSEQDADGILAKNNLAEGYYKLRISADNHDTYEQNVYIGAGETEDIQAFLSRQTVKYTWTVTPTEIEDRYTISIESVFETNVPIPTVVIEPSFIDLDQLQVVGQVMQINVTATNHGLIAANDINFYFGDHPFYKIEPLINNLDILAAKSSITVPVRITRIADFDTLSSFGGQLALQSSPSVPCSISGGLDYYYECAGQQIKRAIPLPFLNVDGNCLSGGGGFGGGGFGGSGFGGGGFGGGGFGGGGFGGGGYVTPITVNLTEPNCDPCKEQNLQASICLTIGLAGCIPGPIGRGVTVFSCAVGFGDGEGDWQDWTGCLTGLGGFVYPPLCIPSILLCLDDFCYDPILGGSSLSTSASVSPINQGLARVAEYRNRVQAIYNTYLDFFGDEVWLNVSSDHETLLVSWLTEFFARTQGATAAAAKITETEQQQLLHTPFPPSISQSNILKLIDRWNRTVDYFETGIYNQSQVPNGQSQDFVDLGKLGSSLNTLETAIAQTEAEGYNDIFAGLQAVSSEYQKALEGSGGVCATVRIKIDQEAVMTRAAFLGSLEIDNGNQTNLTNLSVTLQIKDGNGNIVNDIFGITDPILSNITAVDGTGILTGDNPNTPQDEGIGSAKWTFIPTNLAAPEIPTQYSIGGSLSYLENGATVTVPLLSTPITVYPQAELHLDYFHQRDVFADDPFTDDIIETSVPYSLAVLVRNEGKGDAKNLKITSGQPKIIDNEKGLLVDFQIIGSEVNGQGVSPSLTVNFGNIEAGKTAVADWLLKSSLQGKFTDYKATFEHTNSLGKAELSLIKEVNIHELIHQVKVNHANPDNLPDFLVNETFDAKFTPDIIYFSSGGTAPVKAVKDATIDAPATITDLTVQITATVDNGWTYFELAEPSNSQFDIVKIQRADGTQISLDNFWITDRTFPATGRPIYENILHFLDNTTAGNTTYTITYIPGGPTVTDIIDVSPDPRATAINAITVDFSEAIKANTFDYNDLNLTLNGGSNLINSNVTIVSLSPTRYQITGLNDLTSTDGEYNLIVNATGIQDTSGKFGTGSLNETWIKTATGNSDTTPPIVTDIIDLLIDPRNQPVPSLTVTFSEKIDLSTFTWQDITLSLLPPNPPEGGNNSGNSSQGGNNANLINNSVTVTAVNDTTYRINGLSGLTLTDGTYTLTVNGNGIQDLSGNTGTGIQTETWVMDTTAPTVPTNINVTATPPVGTQGLQPNNTPSLQLLTASGQRRINTTNPNISGELGETGLKVFFYDKTTNTLLQQATVTGTQFSSNVQLPSPGARELEIRVQDAAGNTTNTTLSLFADVTQPILTQFLNVPSSTPNPVNSIDVQFSEQIDLNTFDNSDISLTRDGVNLTLPNTVTVSYISDTTYRINGLDNLTNTPGIYSLRVDATTIQDNAGNSGDAPKTANFTITPPATPGITLTQTGGNISVAEGGNTDTYSLVLKTPPTADVTITLTSGNQITLDKTTFTFNSTNWNTPQTVTVTAVDDNITEGNHTAIINHSVTSTDTNYNGSNIPNVNVGIQDNDAEIKGNIWNDIDGNAVNNNEQNLSNWTVYLDSNNNNQLDSGETSTQTDTNGDYNFTNLRPGTYNVAQIVQEGWKQTYPIFTISTTGANIPLSIPTLELITPTSTNSLTGNSLIGTDNNQTQLNFSATNNQTQLNFSTANYTVKEDGTAITEIIVTRTGDITNSVGATLSFIDGTAKGCACAASSINNDFNNIPFTITFAANEVSKVITVQNAILGNPNAIKIRNDDKVEGDEYFTIQLTNPTNGAIIGNQNTANVTILDDESPSNTTTNPPVTNTNNTPSNTPSSPLNSNAISLINLDDFWADSRFANIKGQGQSIVIIDTGADLNHPLFGPDNDNNGIADRIIYQYDFADNDNDAGDRNNHGSHITSIAAQIAPESNLIILKVFKDNGSGSFSDLEKALQWVNTNANTYNIASVNLSLGDSQNWTTEVPRYGIGDELAAIASQNILIAAAAGNSFYTFNSTPGLAYPAIDPNVISVGAVWADDFGSRTFGNGAVDYSTAADRIASFSQRHPLLDVFAPGILITGANATGGTISMGGTSQATPYISAIATLSQQIAQQYLGRSLTLTEFSTLLDTTSNLIIDGDDENDNVTNTGVSYPRINVLSLAEAILNLNNNSNGSNTGNTGNNGTNDPLYIPDNTVSLVHTVTLTAGQILTDINFGNQLLPTNLPPTLININKTGDEDNTIAFTLTDFTSAFSDSDGNNLTKIQITSLPNNGILKLNNTLISLNQEIALNDLNALTFTPNNNFNGNISFNWNGFDGTVYTINSATVNITINPVDDTPIVTNPISHVTVNEDAANTLIDLINVFSDVDGDIIVKSILTNSNNGLVTATLNNNQLTLDYLDNQFGTANITIRGTANGQAVDNTFTVNVNPIDDTLIVQNSLANLTVNEDAPNTLTDLTNVFSDVDGDIIIKSVLANSNNGLVTATINNNQLTLDYLDNQFGTANITIRGTSNGQTVDNTFKVTVNPVNDTPTNILITNTKISENAPNNTLIANLSTIDPDANDQHTYTLLDNGNGRFKLNGNQLFVNDSSQLDYETAKTHDIILKTTDQNGANFSKTFTIELKDDVDIVTGLAQDEIIVSSVGKGILSGNGGKDIFKYPNRQSAGNIITDFNADNNNLNDHDMFDLRDLFKNVNLGSNPFSNIRTSQIGNNTLVSYAPFGRSVPNYFLPLATLENVQATAIDAGDFIFS